jgi:hypothetical protein
MALHTFELPSSDEPLQGPAGDHTVRLLRLSRAGQILVTEATAVLLRGSLPQEVSLVDHGFHQLWAGGPAERLYRAERTEITSPSSRSAVPVSSPDDAGDPEQRVC